MVRVCVEHVITMTSYKDLSVGDLSKWPIPGVLLFRLVHFLPHSVVSGMGLVPAVSDAIV